MSVVFQHVGHYEIQHEIGRGGMATVFLATDTRTNQRVALKLVPTGRDREAQEILDAEHFGAKLQSQFCRASKHVPAVYEHGTEGSYFYIAMEYLEGRNLSEVMSGGPLIPSRAVSIAMQLCEFLQAAHGFQTNIDGRDLRSLLHGDLKPRNIRVLDDDEVKVLDFGIAKALSLSRKVTRNDFGSIAYLSPERIESGEIDEHADLWAVGVLLYEMIGGVQPFSAPDTRRLEQRIRSRRPPQTLDARCPTSLQAVITKLLAPSQADRYRTAAAAREDLQAFAAGKRTQAETEGWPKRHHDELPTRRTTASAPPIDEEATRRTLRPLAPTVARAAVSAIPAAVMAAIGGSATRTPPMAATATATTAGAGAPPVPPTTSTPSTTGGSRARVPSAKLVARRRFIRRGLLISAFILGLNEFWVGTLAHRASGLVPHRELDTIEQSWEQYDELADRSLNMRLRGLEEALLRQTQLLTDRVAENYKSASPNVREAQWEQARNALARAVSLRPNNSRLRGSLRYVNGHLHRINGEAHKERNQLPEAEEAFTDAVASFREAAEFRPNWPDPFLGLMRTFVSGLDDVDRGADALNEAQKLGFTPSAREYGLLADSYRARGDSLARMARQQSGDEREHEYLSRAAESYREAISAYGKMVGVASADRSMRATQRSLQRIEQRLEDPSGPSPLSIEGLFRWP